MLATARVWEYRDRSVVFSTLLIFFCVNWYICFLKKIIKRFTSGFVTYFKHRNTDHIVTMSFILIKFADNVFNILSVQKLKFGIDLSVIK